MLFAAGVQAQPYLFNRAPLEEVSYAELPLGAIRPEGWLKEQLKRQADYVTTPVDDDGVLHALRHFEVV